MKKIISKMGRGESATSRDSAPTAEALLIGKFEKLVAGERRLTAEILELLREFDARKLYLRLGFTSLHAYLTEGMGYSPAAAQRRIESARLLRHHPEIRSDLESGALNLTQVSMLAQSLRQKSKNDGEFAESPVLRQKTAQRVLSQIRKKSFSATQKVIAQELDLPIKFVETTRIQQDDSIRIEMTLSKEEAESMQRIRNMMSHTHPKLSWAELMVVLGNEYLKRKDPALIEERVQKRKMKAALGHLKKPKVKTVENTSATEVVGFSVDSGRSPIQRYRPPIPAAMKRAVFLRDKCCQWSDPDSSSLCGSRFMLQVDHIIPLWAGGLTELSNLQLLCAVHNGLKYRQEAGIQPDSNTPLPKQDGLSN